jgi:hypothetical protein
MDNRRTESAREHDDSGLIEEIEGSEPTPRFEGRSGGSLQEDIATQAELERVRDPEARERVGKKDDIDHGQATSGNRPPDKTP